MNEASSLAKENMKNHALDSKSRGKGRYSSRGSYCERAAISLVAAEDMEKKKPKKKKKKITRRKRPPEEKGSGTSMKGAAAEQKACRTSSVPVLNWGQPGGEAEGLQSLREKQNLSQKQRSRCTSKTSVFQQRGGERRENGTRKGGVGEKGKWSFT